jgi:hypothetical protein
MGQYLLLNPGTHIVLQPPHTHCQTLQTVWHWECVPSRRLFDHLEPTSSADRCTGNLTDHPVHYEQRTESVTRPIPFVITFVVLTKYVGLSCEAYLAPTHIPHPKQF